MSDPERTFPEAKPVFTKNVEIHRSIFVFALLVQENCSGLIRQLIFGPTPLN